MIYVTYMYDKYPYRRAGYFHSREEAEAFIAAEHEKDRIAHDSFQEDEGIYPQEEFEPIEYTIKHLHVNYKFLKHAPHCTAIVATGDTDGART